MERIHRERLHKWADALLSGEYEQGTDTLAAQLPDGTTVHCCLDVAILTALQDPDFQPKNMQMITPGIYEVERPQGSNSFLSSNYLEGALLPTPVAEYYGLHGEHPWEDGNVDLYYVDETGQERWVSATEANDDMRLSFPQIANSIKATFPLDGEAPQRPTLSPPNPNSLNEPSDPF